MKMCRAILFLTLILVAGCTHRQVVSTASYEASMVGEWKEKAKFPRILETQ
jgi:hypothetical protein